MSLATVKARLAWFMDPPIQPEQIPVLIFMRCQLERLLLSDSTDLFSSSSAWSSLPRKQLCDVGGCEP